MSGAIDEMVLGRLEGGLLVEMEVRNNWIWDILQIETTTDQRKIKKAYARRSKEVHPEEKPEEFQRLYEAYQKAIQYASSGKRTEEYTIEFEKGQEANLNLEKEPVTNEQEQDRYKELGLGPESSRAYQYNKMEKITYFQNWWGKYMPIWLQDEEVSDQEGIMYLQSEEFREIMWSPVVLKIIAEWMGKYFLKKEQVLLFFWDLYGFEEAAEANYKDESLLLYKKLYPAYTNRVKRRQYEKDKDKIQIEEHKHMRKVIIIGICVMAGIIPAIFALAYFKALETVMVAVYAVVILIMLFLLLRGLRG